MRNQRHRKSVTITAVLIVVFCTALLLEGMARLVFAYQDELSGNPFLSVLARGSMVLDPYEMESPTIGGHWTLRPGYPYSDASNHQYRINQYGMRGPEIDDTHSRLRILSLGDSVTFGLSSVTYPRILEETLDKAGVSVEVINGGVEGYAPRNLLNEINRYINLNPEVVTIFIGWNALYSPLFWLEENERFSRFLWFVRILSSNLHRRNIGEKAYAKEILERIPEPEANSTDIIHAENYTPPYLGQIEELVDRLQGSGIHVFLMTLPGLFVSNEEPSIKALKIGHLPAYSRNPYVLATITERYNQSLRDLASRRGAGLIDLALWSKSHLVPRAEFFSDSVHLTDEGLRRIGGKIAEQLKETIGKKLVR